MTSSKAKTILDIFEKSVQERGDQPGFAHKVDGVWTDLTYREVKKRVDYFASGLLELGLEPGDKTAILSENRIEWPIVDLATLSLGVTNVPIYATNTPKKVKYLLENSESRAIVCSTEKQLEKVLEIKDDLEVLEYIICMDLVSSKEGVLSHDEVAKKGEETWEKNKGEVEKRRREIKEGDLVTLLYTSGTTGQPKGVMLSHKNFVSNILSVSEVLPVKKDDEALSFLPLSHSFERCAGYYVMVYNGVKITYAESIDAVSQNMREVSPTVMCSVPRLYEKMHTRVEEKVRQSSFLKRSLFNWALKVGEAHQMALYRDEIPSFFTRLKYKLADKIVFSKIKARTGGRIRYFASGGAPLRRDIIEFFYYMGLTILEGYGQTETSPILTVNTPDNFRFGTVGRPIPGVAIKIAEDGEILAKGDNVMEGYYKKEGETREVIDDEGWLHTGDIGKMEDGFLKITDRKKNIIITAGGKNVAPQKLENLFKSDKYIDEIVAIGDQRKFISALIVPDFDQIEEYAQKRGISYEDPRELCHNEEINRLIEKRLEKLSGDLASYETIKKFTLLKEGFSQESGELTPTMKVKRKVVREKYKDQIDSMYPE